jgi:hypothetical protein
MKIISGKKVYFISVFTGVFAFYASYSLLSYYVRGDQTHYHNFYNLIKGAPFSQVGPIALSAISSAEPLSWLVLWAGSNLGVDKNIWISILNVFLIVGLVALLQKHRAPWYVVALLLTNFYVIVLMTGAERLKIAYIFLIWAFVFEGRWRFLLASLSPLAHLQSLILLMSVFLSSISDQVRRVVFFGRFSKKTFLYILVSVVTVGSVFLYLQDGILRKGQAYASRAIPITELANILLLITIGFLVTKDRFRLFLTLLQLVAVVAMLGGQRVNMIAVSMFIGLMMYERRLSHPLVLLLLFYFSLKSIPFVSNIYRYGNGFGGPLW